MLFLDCDFMVKRIHYFVIFLLVSMIFFIHGCSCAPKLTPEDRKRDIQFLADWAKDYNPFVEVNEKYKNAPSYQALLSRYLEFAENAQNNEEFLQVANGYFEVISGSCHFYLIKNDELLKWAKIASFLGILKVGVTPKEHERARYWARLSRKISTHTHPPFPIVYKEGKYLTDDDWQYDETIIPRGSEIIKVNGMTCSAYLDFIKKNTSLRYDAFRKDWIKQYLLIIDEGPTHRGWQVVFHLTEGPTLKAFVPKIKGKPAPKPEPVRTVEPKANCTCLELRRDVGYIRIKACMSGVLSYLFRGYIKKDRNKIQAFLNQSQGRYNKLIIDFRNNEGGFTQYGYDVLISPFLDKPAKYSHVVGLKKKYLANTDESVLKFLRDEVSTKKAHVIDVVETEPPTGFDPNQWTFFKITRKIEPANRYNFKGDLYVLMNGGCLSTADDTLNAIKRIGLATLVGQNSGGGAAGYVAPPMIVLPASGMAFRVETDLVINPDGSINELFGTPPDIELPDADPPRSITKEELLKDEWIRTVIDKL